MDRITRLAGLLALAIALPACQDIYAPENLGELSVALDISGTPADDATFLVEWTGVNGQAQGSTPFTARHPRQTFSQVPRGTHDRRAAGASRELRRGPAGEDGRGGAG